MTGRAAFLFAVILAVYTIAGCGNQGDDEQGAQWPAPETTQQAERTSAPATTGVPVDYRGPETRQVTITETVDGDTVQIEPAIEGRTDLRLVWVDTPELDSGEPLAEEAATFTEEELAGEQVTLILAEDPVDPYGNCLGGSSLLESKAPTANACCAKATGRRSSTSPTLSIRCSISPPRRTPPSGEQVCGGCLSESVASWRIMETASGFKVPSAEVKEVQPENE